MAKYRVEIIVYNSVWIMYSTLVRVASYSLIVIYKDIYKTNYISYNIHFVKYLYM